MAVWLTMSLSQGTPNESARTTTVSATLTIHYDNGSYDGTEPSGEITIDGQSFPFVKNFNYAGYQQGPATMGTGSTSITVTATVPYGSSSTRTVSASASFSRASGGASSSISLTPISSGGSSGGGGDDDDDNTEEWDPDNPGGGSGGGNTTTGEYKIYISAGTGCGVTVLRNDIMVPMVDGETIYKGDILSIYFDAFSGYSLLTHTLNGSSIDSGTVHVVDGNVVVVITAQKIDDSGDSGGDDSGGGDDVVTQSTKGGFYIDSGTELEEYEFYIDDGDKWIPIRSSSNIIANGTVTTDSGGESYINCGFVPDIIILDRGETHPFSENGITENLVIGLPVPPFDSYTTYSSGILRAPNNIRSSEALEIWVAGLDQEYEGAQWRGVYLYVCNIEYLSDGMNGSYDLNEISTTFNYTAIKYT